MNRNGHPDTLQASHPENLNALKSGVYSPRALQPRAREVADALLNAPHAVPLDQIAAEEIGSLVATLEAIDTDLERHGLTDDEGNARTLLELRSRLSGRLERWLREFGATPASRIEWVERVARGKQIADAVRDDFAVGQRLLEAARQRGAVDEKSTEDRQ
jgi:hypothetical protein